MSHRRRRSHVKHPVDDLIPIAVLTEIESLAKARPSVFPFWPLKRFAIWWRGFTRSYLSMSARTSVGISRAGSSASRMEGLVRGADVQDRLPENEADATLVGREFERGLGLVGNGGLGGPAAHRKKSQDHPESSGAHRVSS